jgi:hypothetical protein
MKFPDELKLFLTAAATEAQLLRVAEVLAK